MVRNMTVAMPRTPPSSSSPPSLTMSGPPSPQRTNTLVIARLPPHFFDPVIQEAFKSHFATFGPLHTWAPIRGLARVIMVYYSEEDAETAKESNDGLVFGQQKEKYAFSLSPMYSYAQLLTLHKPGRTSSSAYIAQTQRLLILTRRKSTTIISGRPRTRRTS